MFVYYSLERFEDQLAVLRDDNGKPAIVDRSLLPPEARAGDLFRFYDGQYRYDADETNIRRERIYRLEQLLRSKKR